MTEITPEQAKTWARDHGTIYDEEKRIVDIEAAWVLAKKEDRMEDTSESESDFERRASRYKGLSEQQKKRIEVMDKLMESAPFTFVHDVDKDGVRRPITDKQGREYLVLHTAPFSTPPVEGESSLVNHIIFLSRDGIFLINTTTIQNKKEDDDTLIREIDWNMIGDITKKDMWERVRESEVSIGFVSAARKWDNSLVKIRMLQPDNIREALQQSERKGRRLQEIKRRGGE